MEFFVGVFENDENDQLKDLKEEQDSIGASVRSLKWRDTIRGGMGGNSLVEFLKADREEITVFHFSGHHGHGLMKVVDGEVDTKPFIDILNGLPKLKLVFINGCESQNFVDDLTNVPIVIGTSKKIIDSYAKNVASAFYAQIAKDPDKFKTSESIEKLFQEVRNFDAMIPNKKEKFANTSRGGDDDDDDDGTEYDVYSIKINKGADNFETRVTYNLNPEEMDVNKSYWEFTQPLVEEVQKAIEEFRDYIEEDDDTKKFKVGDLYKVYPYLFSKYLERLKPQLLESDKYADPELDLEKLSSHAKLSYERSDEIMELHCQLINFLKYCGCSMIWTLHRDKKMNIDQLSKEQKEMIKGNLYKKYYGENVQADGIEGLNQLFLIIDMTIIEDRPVWVKLKNLVHNEQDYLKKTADFFNLFEDQKERDKVGNWLKAEDYLRDFVGRPQTNPFSFLRNLSIWSVYNINFQRFRTSDEKKLVFTKGHFPMAIRPAEGRSELTEWNLEANTEIDIQSVYLMEGQNRILNLTPFYIDMNASDQNADKMEICYLEKYPKTKADVKLKYISIKDKEKHEINEGEKEGDQKKIFEQMKYFWSLISEDD